MSRERSFWNVRLRFELVPKPLYSVTSRMFSFYVENCTSPHCEESGRDVVNN